MNLTSPTSRPTLRMDRLSLRKKNAARFLAFGFNPKQAGFYGMIENIDENVGRLLDKLKQWKQLDHTLIIFLSDKRHDGVRVQARGCSVDERTAASFTRTTPA